MSSFDSKSMEHVIPESLGNSTYILKPGIVCDSCNNYFARKIEGPLLDMPFFKQTRHRLNIESKKGRIPSDKGFIIDPELSEMLFKKDKKQGKGIEIPDENIKKRIAKRKKLPVFIAEFGLFDLRNFIISKFMTKVAIEGLAFDVVKYGGNMDEVVNQESFDNIKRYCRYPKRNEFWPYSIRQIQLTQEEVDKSLSKYLQSLIFHYTFIYIEPGHLFYQLYISGVELTIDMVNPSLENVNKWLSKNPSKSEVLDNALENIMSR